MVNRHGLESHCEFWKTHGFTFAIDPARTADTLSKNLIPNLPIKSRQIVIIYRLLASLLITQLNTLVVQVTVRSNLIGIIDFHPCHRGRVLCPSA